MEGLGEGYEAFVERLQSDFAVSKSSAQNGNHNPSINHSHSHNSNPNVKVGAKLNRSAYPSHLLPSHLPHPKYVGYPSPANAFTVKKEESSSPSESSIRGGRPLVDVAKDEKASALGFPGISRTFSSDLNEVSDVPYHHRGHRRAQSEIAFRLPDDIVFDYEPGFLESSAEADELGDDFLSMLDLEKMNLSSASMALPAMKTYNNINHLPAAPHHARSFSVDQMLAGFNSNEDAFGYSEEAPVERPRHRHSHSYSMDGSTAFPKDAGSSSSEASKTVSANKLAELALIDPKRAKRILANRQSAARSKERKMRYIAELERKVQTLQTEATTLSAQLTLMQNDTTVLTAENGELKFQLQSLEQQTHLSNALNIALKDEVQRLKIATGEVGNNGQMRSREDHPLLSSKQFYRSQPTTDSLLTGQQLQQLQSALKKQQIAKHQNIL